MELKSFQQRVLADLEDYLSCYDRHRKPRAAFEAFWHGKGLASDVPFTEAIPGVPHVCVKVPTGGGKTFLAVNALRPVLELLKPAASRLPRLVIWLVPSLAILQQTSRCFRDPRHPYGERLNMLFRNRVEVYEKGELLDGARFTPVETSEQVSIVILSYDSLRTRNKDARKLYQENERLAPFGDEYDLDAAAHPSADATAFISVIRAMNPVVVVDESHNAGTPLSEEMLRDLNPAFILDLTATPRAKANIISYVDALALKSAHMVKLPVIVYNRSDKADVISAAISLRKKLEAIATDEERQTGLHIRPIVLFQAEPRTGVERETFVKIKQKLIEWKIPEEQIRIKTAELDELKDEKLGSRECPVRFIITVNALKEGWDCPFAYILASLAPRSSIVDVEQLVGRVLRQPHVTRHTNELLNMSYVFTSSDKFHQTLDTVVRGLNRAGFSRRDVRDIEPEQPEKTTEYPLQTQPKQAVFTELGEPEASDHDSHESEDESSIPNPENLTPEAEIDIVFDIERRAESCCRIYSESAKETEAGNTSSAASDEFFPPGVGNVFKRHTMKDMFVEEARSLVIPQFFLKSTPEFLGEVGDQWRLLEHKELLGDFPLGRSDAVVTFQGADVEMYKVDLEQIGKHDATPTYKRTDAATKRWFDEHLKTLPRTSRIRQLAGTLREMLGKYDHIIESEMKLFLRRILEGMTDEQLQDCMRYEAAYLPPIRAKIDELATAWAEKSFADRLMTGEISLRPSFHLPESIVPQSIGPSISGSLYAAEGEMNEFERKVISEIAHLPNVSFWHRNLERTGFRINGFINQYPDFIIRTKSNILVVVETKGGDRDNTDSMRKLKLGREWANRAGDGYRYFMIFENQALEGSYPITEALTLLSRL